MASRVKIYSDLLLVEITWYTNTKTYEFGSEKISFSSCTKILRGIVLLPLNVAAHAGFLLYGDGGACYKLFDGAGQVLTGHRFIVAGTGAVELAAIDEFFVGVEKKNIRGAGGAVGLGRRLIFIDKIGKGKAECFGYFHHPFRTVIRILAEVVTVDGDNLYSLHLVLLYFIDQLFSDMDDIRAVVTHEDDKKAFVYPTVGKNVGYSIRRVDIDRWCFGSEFEHC